jgi:hypothetical protein
VVRHLDDLRTRLRRLESGVRNAPAAAPAPGTDDA